MKKVTSRAMVALAGAAMLAVGCAQTQPAPEQTPPAGDAAVIDVEDTPGVSDDGFEGARSDVDDFTCDRGQGEWTVVGTVTNPLEETVSYRIYTSFIDSERDRALLQIDVTEVEPGETREWDGSVAVDDDDLRCVLRVERTISDS